MNYRIESDSIGSKKIPIDAYYGVQSLRGYENFKITGFKLHEEFIKSLVEVKKAAAIVNCDLGLISNEIKDVIVKACDEILAGKFIDQFIVDPIQGGAGTSMNMNANEVIANRAIELLNGKLGDYSIVDPNDHVNCSQSTNDVIPTAGKITAIKLLRKVIVKLSELNDALLNKANELDDVIKMGRTQLQDAVPIRLGQEFCAYSIVLQRDLVRLKKVLKNMESVNIGGTAIGTGINADIKYTKNMIPCLSKITGIPLLSDFDLIDGTQNLDSFLEISGTLKTCAVNLSKIANDLRLLSSGPRAGLSEINLPAMQNGSSIMPGKVNPVIPEVINQIAFNLMGNDLTITLAVEAGQLELNAFEPIIFFNLFQSLDTLTNGIDTFTKNCIVGITANKERCKAMVDNSIGVVTALCPYIGYKDAANLAKDALNTGRSVKDLILEKGIMTEDELVKVLDPYKMTEPGIPGK
ncbi:MAG: aspartate ammonia-lyase [Oscillospiraceae bacterium]|nr:aspartate ammonia-lyase [Oscillospiraceae bacterium]